MYSPYLSSHRFPHLTRGSLSMWQVQTDNDRHIYTHVLPSYTHTVRPISKNTLPLSLLPNPTHSPSLFTAPPLTHHIYHPPPLSPPLLLITMSQYYPQRAYHLDRPNLHAQNHVFVFRYCPCQPTLSRGGGCVRWNHHRWHPHQPQLQTSFIVSYRYLGEIRL